MVFELFKQVKDLLKGLHLRLDALVLAIGRNLQAEGQRDRVEGILLLLVVVGLQVAEEHVLGRDLLVVLEMVRHLDEVVGETVEVDRARDRRPPEVEVRLLIVVHFGPEGASSFLHDTPDKLRIVAVEDLVLEKSASLGLRHLPAHGWVHGGCHR